MTQSAYQPCKHCGVVFRVGWNLTKHEESCGHFAPLTEFVACWNQHRRYEVVAELYQVTVPQLQNAMKYFRRSKYADELLPTKRKVKSQSHDKKKCPHCHRMVGIRWFTRHLNKCNPKMKVVEGAPKCECGIVLTEAAVDGVCRFCQQEVAELDYLHVKARWIIVL